MTAPRLTGSVNDLGLRTPRSVVRHVALDARSVIDRVRPTDGDPLDQPRLQHVFWHHVYPDEARGFRRQVEDLAERHHIVPYGSGIDALAERAPNRPTVSLSFDDGLATCLDAGRILADIGVSACFFLVAGAVGETDPDELERFCRDRLAMPPTALLTWDEVEQLQSLGHEIGSHGWSHRRLTDLSSDEVDDELGRSHQLLEERTGPVRHFAWPYGHLDEAPADIAARAHSVGYRSVAANVRGCHVAPLDPAREPILRDHLLANWPVRHVHGFLRGNARRAAAELVAS